MAFVSRSERLSGLVIRESGFENHLRKFSSAAGRGCNALGRTLKRRGSNARQDKGAENPRIARRHLDVCRTEMVSYTAD